MRERIRTEQIYDAAVDDEAFAHLPALMAKALGARSAVLHWQASAEGCGGEFADTGYFTQDHMAEYDRHFSHCDLWSQAVKLPSLANRGWNCEQLISPAVFETSRIYNEWIRPMGDDTARGLGAVIHGPWGSGEVGFHRGRRQGAFDDDCVKMLNDQLGHLRRMLNIRARLAGSERGRRMAESSLDALGDGVMSLSIRGRLLHANAAAERILRRGDGLCLSSGQLSARSAGDQSALRSALLRAGAPEEAEASGLLVSRTSGGNYIVSLLSVSAPSADRTIIAVVSETAPEDPRMEDRLRSIFNLTSSEARLARRLADGATVEEVAIERGTALATVRSQMKAVAAKLNCRRQAEVVAIVKDVPRLRRDA